MPTQQLIQSAAPRVVNKRSGGQITLYEVMVNGQQYIARKPVFDQACALIGQQALVETRQEQNGNFTNLYLDAVQPLGFPTMNGGPPPQVFHPDLFPQVPTQQPMAAPVAPPQPVSQVTDRDRQIWRQSACKVAAHVSKGPVEFWGNVTDLIRFFETGQQPSLQQALDNEPDLPF